MQNKERIFAEIQQILTYDYAKCNMPVAHEQFVVTPNMRDDDFVQMLERYIASFEDQQLAIQVKNDVRHNIGFSVRRYEQVLYVTEASDETRLHIGDVIVEIDGVPVADIANDMTQQILMRAKEITVQQRSTLMTIVLTHYRRKPYKPMYEAKVLQQNCLYMKFTDFGESYPIQRLLAQYEDTLRTVDNVIIDVRQNYGGNDVYMYPLLDYVFDAPTSLKELYKEEKEYTNFTPRNCQLLLQMYEDYLREPLDNETVRALDYEMFQIEQHRGKGFVEVTQDVDYIFEGTSMPKNIYVLTDKDCAGTGEMLVALAKKSPKVTVVGRSTKGTMATFNVVGVDFGELILYYPTSIMDEKSVFASNEGIAPHIDVPWTPQHLIEDVDVKKVLSQINTSL